MLLASLITGDQRSCHPACWAVKEQDHFFAVVPLLAPWSSGSFHTSESNGVFSLFVF